MYELLHNSLSVTEPGFFAFVAAMLAISLFAARIAKKKGYSGRVLLWAWIPLINIYGLVMFTNLPDLHVRAKADALAARLAPPSRTETISSYQEGVE
ncbi:hypothetical protein KL86DPRO_10793 [uncultured delta proteobacterium]|uniref:Uncharacterized protein n=1 Tax=uncultured delta proteobacterium TaxID=34034 RepID=A0A212J695_9DELT|nr:hypothetical protein KL86DPRO_10793 [uncultured delta proteobacterium]